MDHKKSDLYFGKRKAGESEWDFLVGLRTCTLRLAVCTFSWSQVSFCFPWKSLCPSVSHLRNSVLRKWKHQSSNAFKFCHVVWKCLQVKLQTEWTATRWACVSTKTRMVDKLNFGKNWSLIHKCPRTWEHDCCLRARNKVQVEDWKGHSWNGQVCWFPLEGGFQLGPDGVAHWHTHLPLTRNCQEDRLFWVPSPLLSSFVHLSLGSPSGFCYPATVWAHLQFEDLLEIQSISLSMLECSSGVKWGRVAFL